MISESEVSGKRIFITVPGLSASSASQSIFVAPNSPDKFRVIRAAARFHVASTSGTVQVEVADAGVAPGSGVNQLDSTLDLSGTVDTNVGEGASAPTEFGEGSVLNLILGGTLTGLADCDVVVELERV